MSETHNTQEHNKKHEKELDSKEIDAKRNELLRDSKEKAEKSKNEHAENLNKIREDVEKEAASAQESAHAELKKQDEPDAANTYWYSREYRELAFKQLMSKVQGHLSAPEKVGSKLIHQPLVEKVSEMSEKTIARPSGVLAGSIFSFVSSILTYYFAKRNGYDMTYSIFFVSFIGGFVIGIVAEFGYRGVRALMSRD